MFIVLEGLDGVGKSTLIRGLREVMDAKTIRTPAPWMSGIRTDFEDMSDEITSSYYDLCNKVASEDVKNSKGRTIVCDRYAVSTASRRLSERFVRSNEHSFYFRSLYSWEYPKDLIEPDICLHIRLDEQVRAKRVRERGGMTESEYRLEKDARYRSNILNIFDTLCDVVVDITGLNPDDAVKHVLNSINAFKFRRAQTLEAFWE